MSLKHIGSGKFVDTDPLDIEEAAPKEWSPGIEKLKFYPWVEFYSLERAGYGILATEGAYDAEIVASVEVGEQMFDPTAVAALSEIDEMVSLLEEGKKGLIEEFPFSEIAKKEDYERAVAACLNLDVPRSPKDWSPRERRAVKEESKWEGSGVYDMRDCPPTRHAKSVEEYELSGMEYYADDTLDYMYQGDEWEESLRGLIQEIVEQ